MVDDPPADQFSKGKIAPPFRSTVFLSFRETNMVSLSPKSLPRCHLNLSTLALNWLLSWARQDVHFPSAPYRVRRSITK